MRRGWKSEMGLLMIDATKQIVSNVQLRTMQLMRKVRLGVRAGCFAV